MTVEGGGAGCDRRCARTDCGGDAGGADGGYRRYAGGPGDGAGYVLGRRVFRVAECPGCGKLRSLTHGQSLSCRRDLNRIQPRVVAADESGADETIRLIKTANKLISINFLCIFAASR